MAVGACQAVPACQPLRIRWAPMKIMFFPRISHLLVPLIKEPFVQVPAVRHHPQPRRLAAGARRLVTAQRSVWRQPQRVRFCMQAREGCDLRQDEREEKPPSRTWCGHVRVELNLSDAPQHDVAICLLATLQS